MIKIYRDFDMEPNPIDDMELILQILKELRKDLAGSRFNSKKIYNATIMHTFTDAE